VKARRERAEPPPIVRYLASGIGGPWGSWGPWGLGWYGLGLGLSEKEKN
jgi:hypothetical protein